MSAHATSTAANVELLRSTFAAFNADDLGTCLANLAEDFVINLAGVPQMRGRDTWRQGVEVMKRAFPDVTVQIEDVVASDDRVAVRLTLRGTHTGEFEGIPATGRAVEYSSNEFYRFADGVIAEEWICSDTATLHRQIT
ncbi:ester cyclase [Geodermatophilus maliterrae]|uniref:Ester cyclase n=1 Tax=Geodermatophilus maliterrae TaxID=3162531 RepID=A0ABV3XMK6_9ACTN